MIRHNDGNPQIEFRSVVVKTRFQHNGTHPLRKDPPVVRAKCYEVLPVITLKMRELPPVKSLRHGKNVEQENVGTAALGCPGAKLRSL
jgi:hypothetical protein